MTDNRVVHIVDDDDGVRRSAGFLLRTSGYTVVAHSSGTAFLKVAVAAEPGCVLLDVRMPDIDGLEVQRQMTARGIAMPVVVLTGHGDLSVGIRAMKAGAVDFIEKPFEKAVLLAAIVAAFERLEDTAGRTADAETASCIVAGLTPREHSVLAAMAEGLPNKTIAHDLGISARTVEVHRANLMAKLNVRSLSGALRIAFAAGLGNGEAATTT
jgi:two-component system response regulator FixJ